MDEQWTGLVKRATTAIRNDKGMTIRKRIGQCKPIVKRLLVMAVFAAPVTALTNNLGSIRKSTAAVKEDGKKPKSFFDHRCLGIKPPAP